MFGGRHNEPSKRSTGGFAYCEATQTDPSESLIKMGESPMSTPSAAE